MKKTLCPILIALLAAGCTTATHQSVNALPETTSAVSQSLENSPEQSLKRVVAIARFTDETKRGTSFLLDKDGNKIGKQASDILASRLTATNKFIMLERSDINKLQEENNLSGEQLQKVGADYLIVGSVSEFGRSTKSDVGIFSRNKIQTANATVNVRLINTHTGQIVFSQEASGEAKVEANNVFHVGKTSGYDSSIDDKALSAAISRLVSDISENLMDAPWQAYLVGQQDGMWMMTGGKSQGVKKGDEFAVLEPGKKVKNPQTGLMIELPGTHVATVKVAGFIGKGDNELSLCKVESGSIPAKKMTNLIVREQGEK